MDMAVASAGMGGGQLAVPPGFRFHPTEEELLYYYLKKKVSFEPIDLDVIREIDLNKLEPWELKDKCKIGSGMQQERYFFSHKDKKYPTGTRTNRATAAGFWKATGRDKAIHIDNSKQIGRRKTLVFYTGRAPRGQKTDWIMYEYRLDDNENEIQEEGWVVCRVFKKKNHLRGFHQEDQHCSTDDNHHTNLNPDSFTRSLDHHHYHSIRQSHQSLYDHNNTLGHSSMHLPQLFSPVSAISLPAQPFISMNVSEIECSQNLLRLTSDNNYGADWSFLDKLLAHQQQPQCKSYNVSSNDQTAVHGALANASSSSSGFPFRYLGNETDLLKFSK